jgi:hypothetical protein
MHYSIHPLLNQKLAVLALVPVLFAQPVAQSSPRSGSNLEVTSGTSSAAPSVQGTTPSSTETGLPSQAPPPGQTHLQTQANSSQQEVSCPTGQFASAFPDVKPTDWAYEAVNRLAATPIRCFPITQPR